MTTGIHTDAQLRAIEEIDCNLQIIACAGSGKTRVVAERVLHILESKRDQGIGPENVVAFTFTEKAAAELKDRITRLYRDRFGDVEGLGAMYVGTIHGFCLELLQTSVPEYLKYDVLDEIGQRLFVDRHSTASGLTPLGLRRWIESNVYLRLLGTLREADIDESLISGTPLADAFDAYTRLLEARRYLDYDGILVNAVVEIESNEALRVALADRVLYLTVDEYQDVNPIQERLVRQLHDLGANICVVGDDDQNIYQWRGSDVEHILHFADRYPNVVTSPLETNFRSSTAIVSGARRIVERNTRRLTKAMGSGSHQVFERGDLLALTFTNPVAEAAWIAEKIEKLHGLAFTESDGTERGLAYSDVAVLLRSVRGTGQNIIDALRDSGIPYIVTGMTGLFDSPEVYAACGLFERLIGQIDDATLRDRWRDAGLGLTDAQIDAGLDLLAERSSPDTTGNRFDIYNLQRVFLDFLDRIALREETVPGGRGEVAYYNLGKFSQCISDYEAIHFRTEPRSKYESFVKHLRFQAPSYYPEGGQDAAYAVPDAVRIMTVHQAKGLEFPVVFLPCLQRNRFPSKKQHNRVWSFLPKEAVRNPDRYDGDEEDERRLMYVALTRAEKYLFCSWAPDPTKKLYKRPSSFFDELTHDAGFLTAEPAPSVPPRRLTPQGRRPLMNVELSFSDLKYFFECPYQFKLRLLYGFNPPIHEALGYGRSLHNVLAEVHQAALAGTYFGVDDAQELVTRHLQVRYAYPALEEQLRHEAEKATVRYLREQGPYLDKLVHVEESVELTLPDGIVVNGRIDLVRRTDTNETSIVDFKSTKESQATEVTKMQLHLYALGYEERFGQLADLIEIHNLDEGGSTREVVSDDMSKQTIDLVLDAGDRLRTNRLERLPKSGVTTCASCDVRGICREKPE
ncbi:MAG: ATP-dependent DNA helicase [Dehalococcoidia bacterium]